MTTTSKLISDAIETGISNATSQGVPDWLGATDALIDLFVEHGECFSSGELAAHIRTFKPDLRFSVTTSIGAHVRDRFWGGTFPLYMDDAGDSSPVEMVPRTTQGYTRTPVGTEVFVYGPDQMAASTHEFEVEIPQPGTQVPVDPQNPDGLPAVPKQAPTPVQTGVKLTPRPARDLKAVVQADRRCYVPRAAFEALLHETGTSLKGGDSVYVIVDDAAEEARVGLDREQGAQAFQLIATRGRVLFPHPAHPFTPGDSYAVTVDGDNRRLIVDLSTAL